MLDKDGRVYLTLEQWGQIMAKAWLEPDFKEAFEKDPRRALQDFELGFSFDCFFNLPPRPKGLTDGQIDNILDKGELTFPFLTV